MKKVLMLLLVTVATLGCGEDKLKVIHNNDRVSELERRADLNDQLNALQNQRLDLLEAALAAEEAARIAGDVQLGLDLSYAIWVQSLTNFSLQSQINVINLKLLLVNAKLVSLQNQINNLNIRLSDLEADVAQLASDMADLEASLQGQIDDLATAQAATQAQLDQEGVKLFKCHSSSSTERIMKINGYFYAVMNRVKTASIQVITGSSSQSYSTPDMCETWDGNLKLPNAGGQCTPNSGPFKSTKIPGQTTVVQSYSTGNVTVVTEVKIALDILKDGGYVTTDGAAACSFSISGNGTASSGLIPVQGGLL